MYQSFLQFKWNKIKAFCVLLSLYLCLCLPASVWAAPGVNAYAYAVMDAETGQILFGQNMDTQYDPASITKVMTLGLACQKAQGDWDIPLTVTYDDIATIANTGSSHIALQEGEIISLRDALYAVMMSSANDAANVLAEYIGGDIAGGVAAMNAQVAALGLSNTHFDNPHGLDTATHKVTAADMADILRWATQQPGFLELFCNHEMYTMQPTNKQEKVRYFSLSDSVRIGSSKYYVPEVIGSKTGYTDTSRYTYVALGEDNGRQFICVTLHSQEKIGRYQDARTLFDYAFAHFQKVEVPMANEPFSVDVYGGNARLGTARVTEIQPVSFYLYDGVGADGITAQYDVPEQYIIGGGYEASVTYTLPASDQQDAASITLPLKVEGVEEIIQANVGVELPASLLLLPSKHVSVLVWVLLIAVLVGVGIFVWNKRRYKYSWHEKRYYAPREKRLHKYKR